MQFSEIKTVLLFKAQTKCIVKNQSQKSPKQDILQNHFLINQTIFVFYEKHATNYFASLGILCFRDAGLRGNKITAALEILHTQPCTLRNVTKAK